jgi:hypothetical protein
MSEYNQQDNLPVFHLTMAHPDLSTLFQPTDSEQATDRIDRPRKVMAHAGVASIDSAEVITWGEFKLAVRAARMQFSLVTFLASDRHKTEKFTKVLSFISKRQSTKPVTFRPMLNSQGSAPQKMVDNTLRKLGDGRNEEIESEIGDITAHNVGRIDDAGPGFNAVSSSSLSPEGHQTVLAGRVEFGFTPAQLKSLVNPDIANMTMLRSFPFVATAVVPPELSEGFISAKNKRAFVKEHIDEIRAFTKKLASGEGRDLKGLFVLLGDSCVIQVVHTFSRTQGDLQISGMTAATTSIHGVDGINHWVLGVNMKSNKVFVVNIGYGEHKLLLGDFSNNFGGEPMMGTMRVTIPYTMLAQERGVPVIEYLRQNQPDLYRNHWCFALLDRTFVSGLSFLRRIVGGNTAVDVDKKTLDLTGIDISDVESVMTSSIPETTKPAGLYIDGTPIISQSILTSSDCSTAGNNLMSPITEQQSMITADAVKNITRYNLSEKAVDDLRMKIANIVSDYLPNNIDINASTRAVYDSIRTDPGLFYSIHKQIRVALANDDVMAAIKDEIAGHEDFTNLQGEDNFLDNGDFGDVVELIANDHIYKHVVYELIKPNGLVPLWIQSQIDDHIKPQLVNFDLDVAVQEKMKELQEKERLLEATRKNREQLSETDRRVEEAEREVRRSEEAVEDAKKEMDGVNDMQDLNDNEERRQEQRQRDQDAERDRMFNSDSKGKERK